MPAMPRNPSTPWILLTGATGQLGSCILHELLVRGHRVMCLVRAATPATARSRLAAGVRHAHGDIEPELESGRLAVLRGDLREPGLGIDPAVAGRLRGALAMVIHAAGSTIFESRSDGEPIRTNVDGTRGVFRLAAECGCRNWHFVSTAYVCGHRRHAREEFYDRQPEFRNVYEFSKWAAEDELRSAAERAGAKLTVHRPGVIVGHSQTGATSLFAGIYYIFRGTSLLARAAEQCGDDRHRIPLRIRADATARPNLSFVDDVARDLVDIAERPAGSEGVFHLTHPKPPTNRVIKRALEQFYKINGGRFIGADGCVPAEDQSDYERIFTGALGIMSDYLLDSPRFARDRTDASVRRTPTPWSMSRLLNLLAFAEGCNWRSARPRDGATVRVSSYADYFRNFLPQRIAHSQIARMGSLDLEVRYVIEGADDGDWLCRFRCGKLEAVERTRGQAADVTYRLDSTAFWQVVSGGSTTSDLFLSGGARIEGDVERALKFAGIVQEFVREFPYECAYPAPTRA